MAETRRQKASRNVDKILQQAKESVASGERSETAAANASHTALLGLLVVEVAALVDAFEGVQ